jgi:hypothetical protein
VKEKQRQRRKKNNKQIERGKYNKQTVKEKQDINRNKKEYVEEIYKDNERRNENKIN